MTSELGFAEQSYGSLGSVQAIGMIIGCIGYGSICRRIPFGWIVCSSIAARRRQHAGAIGCSAIRQPPVTASFIYGLAWQFGLLGQLDLSARICPTQSAGTVFALLMAISNSGQSLRHLPRWRLVRRLGGSVPRQSPPGVSHAGCHWGGV